MCLQLKKINDWVDYCEKYAEKIFELRNTVKEEREKNLKTIQNFINALHKPEVNRFKNVISVKSNSFEVVFELDEKSAYMSRKIMFTGDLTTIINLVNKK